MGDEKWNMNFGRQFDRRTYMTNWPPSKWPPLRWFIACSPLTGLYKKVGEVLSQHLTPYIVCRHVIVSKAHTLFHFPIFVLFSNAYHIFFPIRYTVQIKRFHMGRHATTFRALWSKIKTTTTTTTIIELKIKGHSCIKISNKFVSFSVSK